MASIEAEIFESAASAWEVTTKVRLGKLPGAENFAGDFSGRVEKLGFRKLEITMEHAQRAGLLPGCSQRSFRPDADRSAAGRKPSDRQQ